MKRFKSWLLTKFLPAYAKSELEELKKENEELRQEIKIRDAYIAGLQEKTKSRIKIYNNWGDKK